MAEMKYKPQKVEAFTYNVEPLMPEPKDIPKEFDMTGNNKWVKLFDDMFFNGVKNLNLVPKPGIDKDIAFKHIRTIMGSFQPAHEDKTAACAYLFSLWFEESSSWERAK